MKEFGSDFHLQEDFFSQRASLADIYREAVWYASGRQAIVDLINRNGWRRIWMPEYFCYEVIKSIKKTGVELAYYIDYPFADDDNKVKNIHFKSGDALFRINYFGLRDYRTNNAISVPVIEDHSHDLLGHWALYSDADWCIASLRKSLPLAEGGMLWSPKKYALNDIPSSEENETMSEKRWSAMRMKLKYLNGEKIDKNIYRKIYIETEEYFGKMQPCHISSLDMEYVTKLDINAWYKVKKNNWNTLKLALDGLCILIPEDDFSNPFSLILLFNDSEERNRVRANLINRKIYPAILWNVPSDTNFKVKDFGERMLSIPCDGRYNFEDIEILKNEILKSL